MNKNKGIKATLVILVIVCICQMFSISTLRDTIEDLENRLFNVERKARENENNIMDFLTDGGNVELADWNFDLKAADVSKGIVEIEFAITPYDVTENTSVIVSNGLEKVTLTKNGDSFVGTLNYPMDKNTYETSYSIYEGDYEKTNYTMDWLGSGLWANKCLYAGFDGITSYGNTRLTLAGNIEYVINVEDKIVSSKLVFMDNVVDLKGETEGLFEINYSEIIQESIKDEFFKELYLEVETDTGYVYRVYPYISADLTYSLQVDGDNGKYIYQSDEIEILKDGKVLYELRFY